MDCKEIEKRLSDNGVKFWKRGSDPNLVIVGYDQTYGAYDPEKDKQLNEIIRLLEPDYVLHSNAGYEVYDPKEGELYIYQGVSKYGYEVGGELENFCCSLIPLSKEMGFIIVGTGLSMREMRESAKIKESLGEDLVDQILRDPKVAEAKNKRMADRISEFLEINGTRPLISIHDSQDIYKDSPFLKKLNGRKIGYFCIDLETQLQL